MNPNSQSTTRFINTSTAEQLNPTPLPAISHFLSLIPPGFHETVRERAFASRTPRCKRDYSLIFQPYVSIYSPNTSKWTILSSSPAVREHQPGIEWKTPERSKIRAWRADGKSYSQIMKMCGTRDGKHLITRSTIQKSLR